MNTTSADRRSACDEAIEDLLNALGPSLLQYLDEAGAWTDLEHADAQATLDRLAVGQRASFEEVAGLVTRRHVLPELETYPSEFGSYHYLALDFLMTRLIANQIGVVAAADAAIAACARTQALRIIERVREREAECLAELRKLIDRLRESPVSRERRK
ncbi:MAG: hypothetical protein M3552_07790 [Planctomycetota bacterium]|nr:hypothetical protein [Planctomycetaceae bacterium]MDQ3330539.1 hypothetical protein [Planctomycetota bacterium]